MKICISADTHLFSTGIGGEWSEDSFKIFGERILPKIKEITPDILIFLGDILDPTDTRKLTVPNWKKGDEMNLRFSNLLKESEIKIICALKGNHDHYYPLKNVSEMRVLHYIDNDWVVIDDIGFYFFTSRYPSVKKATDDLKLLLSGEFKKNVKKSILLMHENLTLGERNKRIPSDIIDQLSRKFYMTFNGHEHQYKEVRNNIWCVPSALPVRPWEQRCDIFVENEMRIEHTKQFGFFFIDTDDHVPKFVPIDIGIDIIIMEEYFNKEPIVKIRERLIEISEKLTKIISSPKKTIVRVNIHGELNEGDMKADLGLSSIEKEYFSHFYESNRAIININDLRGGRCTYMSKENLRNLTIHQALSELESKRPGSIDFYNEIEDLMDKKTLNWGKMSQRIKQSRFFGSLEPKVEEEILKLPSTEV